VRTLLLRNCAVEDLSTFRAALEAAGHRCRLARADESEALPAADGFDLVIVGGAGPAAADSPESPARTRVRDWLSRALAAGTACLGVGGGAHALAALLGGATRPLAAPRIGSGEVRLTDAGEADALFDGFPSAFPAFHWHRDALAGAPDGAPSLAEADAEPVQAFRKGRVAGVLFHLEMAPRDVLRWTKEYPGELEEAGVSAGRMVGDAYARAPAMKPLAARLVRNVCALAARP
jgi:GMP synthase (glutamine-hydrolysing)